ncbi:MAG: two-component system response regulator ArcA [Plesiomonas sp.]|uniref:two-component system response regulator ArcA n=1 Tax=Plesiomonas sp. TaxID=2486279 RepID=UPI003F3C3237
MQTPHILIVEDELVTRNTLKSIFEAEGYMVHEANDGTEMHQMLSDHDISLVIMDINLPGKNGLLLARELREQANIALMFLTGRDNEVDKILGLEIGADDYITKPFNPRELTIRARNLLSRTMNIGSSTEERRLVEEYCFNGWTLDINSRSLVSPAGEQFKLPRSEFRAMLHFCENPGKIQSRAELLKKMTGRELKPHDRTVDVTIRRIRKHFESVADTPEIIATIHGEGYRFCGELEE